MAVLHEKGTIHRDIKPQAHTHARTHVRTHACTQNLLVKMGDGLMERKPRLKLADFGSAIDDHSLIHMCGIVLTITAGAIITNVS